MADHLPAILIIVENLPVPLDRRVWQESCALRDAGYEVVVICPKMRGYTKPYELLDDIHIYRHWIERGGGWFCRVLPRVRIGALGRVVAGVEGVATSIAFKLIHLCNPPDLLWLVAWPFKALFGTKVIYDVHDAWPEMFEAKFGGRGVFYWAVRVFERSDLRGRGRGVGDKPLSDADRAGSRRQAALGGL